MSLYSYHFSCMSMHCKRPSPRVRAGVCKARCSQLSTDFWRIQCGLINHVTVRGDNGRVCIRININRP